MILDPAFRFSISFSPSSVRFWHHSNSYYFPSNTFCNAQKCDTTRLLLLLLLLQIQYIQVFGLFNLAFHIFSPIFWLIRTIIWILDNKKNNSSSRLHSSLVVSSVASQLRRSSVCVPAFLGSSCMESPCSPVHAWVSSRFSHSPETCWGQLVLLNCP